MESMKIIRKSFVFLVFLTASLLFFSYSHAQDAEKSDKKETVSKQKDEVEYLPITRASLSQLYWRMGAYDISNDIDIDNFMLLNKCKLYRKFYRDDFEWHKIRVRAQKSLEKNVKNFPSRLMLVQPIHLNRYNFKDQAFPLTNYIDTRRFEVEAEEEWPCKDVGGGNNIWKYPHRAIITFSNPISVYSVGVLPEVAKAYNQLYSNVSLHTARPAYIAIKFKVYEANPVPKKTLGISKHAEISAIVEQIDFYADFDLKFHLATLDYRRRNQKFMSGEGVSDK